MTFDLNMICDDTLESSLDCFQETKDVLSVMRQQELTTYLCEDYMARRSCAGMGVDEAYRQRMCEWMHVVADHYSIDRQVVAIAISYLDLCMSKRAKLITTPRHFQLAAVSCLHLAMKLNDHCNAGMKPESLNSLGRGRFTAEDVLAMEQHVIATLDWKLNPPSSATFLEQYLNLLDYNISPSTKYMIAEVSRFILEMSVCVYRFKSGRPSVLAYAAMIIAMDHVDDTSLPMMYRLQLYQRMACIAKLPNTSQQVMEATRELEVFLVEQTTDVRDLIKELDPQGFVGLSHPHERKIQQRRASADSPIYVGLSRYVTP